MTPYAGRPRVTPFILRSGGLFIALACAAALSACSGKDTTTTTTIEPPPPTVGSLNVNVNPPSATVIVTGPASYTKTFIGDRLIVDLAPGEYTASGSAPGFVDASAKINIVAGLTSSVSLVLPATALIVEAPRAVYRDSLGNLVPLDATSIQAGKLFFYAWLQDEPLGIGTTGIVSGVVGDPGLPLLREQNETAPSFSQNLGVAWVGFMDAAGIVHPVIGADVRWEIDQWWAGRLNSMQFGTSDDNRVALGYGVFDDQADTRTNNSHLTGERFPFVTSQYPLYNVTGITTPFADGLTWVTLFSPDKLAEGRIVAVATINGEEIGKQILYKHFAPAPTIEITKSVKPGLVTMAGGTATATWTVTVTNTGLGDATSVDLGDILASGPGANYTLGPLPAGVTQVGDGFTYSFPLPSASTPPPPPTAQLLGSAQDVAILANATVTNTGSSVVSGQVGVSAGSAVDGFPPGIVLNGTIHNNDAVMVAAQAAVTTAYADLAARPDTHPVNTALSDGVLTKGVYSYSSSADLTGPLVLDAEGDPTAEFVFNIGSTLTTAAGASVSLINGASICNVYWRVGTSATIGAGSAFVGSILAQSSVTLNTGASLAGRALARTGAVTLDNNAVTIPVGCGAAPVGAGAPNVKTLTFTATVDAPGTYCNEAQVNAVHVGTSTSNPVDLTARACFTAIESNLSLVKDFVAMDNTTSLGKALTVAANVPAKLRVRVINSGSAAASNVLVTDVLDTASANYRLSGLSQGVIDAAGTGYSFAAGNILAGASTTMLFTVVGSADGTYCDTATVTAVGATIGVGVDHACLTVATPSLTITKVNAPTTVIPSATYTSTIVVKNTGAATARSVVISDLIGFNPAANIRVTYVSSSLNGASGTLAINTVTANTVDIRAGESLTFTVVSRIPIGAVAGSYCDTATVTSSNAATQNANACVTVPAFSALQTQLVDSNDPVNVGGSTTYFSVLFVEALSNEGVGDNKLTYSFGMASPTVPVTAGDFRVVSTRVYFDSKPVTDPITGMVVSDTASPTAVRLTEGTDYTMDDTTPGLETITFTPTLVLRPNTAFYVVHVVSVPTGTALQLYNSGYVWESASAVTPANKYTTNKMEPTTVIQ